MSKFEVNGVVLRVNPVKQISDKFSKREIIVEIDRDSKYPQAIQFEATGDRMIALDAVGPGDEVRVEFELRGRDTTKNGETRNWTNLGCWKIDVTKKSTTPIAATADDLPF